MSDDKCIVCKDVMFGTASLCEDCDELMCPGCLYVGTVCGSKNSVCLCMTCFNQREENNTPAPVDPYRQAFEALAAYTYRYENIGAIHRIIIYSKSADKSDYNNSLFDDYSSDYFTLMQYFYKWEKAQKAS